MCGVGLPEIVLNPLPFIFLSGLVFIWGFTAALIINECRVCRRVGGKERERVEGEKNVIESVECNHKR